MSNLIYPWATAQQATDGAALIYKKITGGTVAADEFANAALAVESFGLSQGFHASGVAVADPEAEFKTHFEQKIKPHLAAGHKLGDGTFLKGLPWPQILQIVLQLVGTFGGGALGAGS